MRAQAVTGDPARLFDVYALAAGAYDELFEAPGVARADVARVVTLLDALGRERYATLQRAADAAFVRGGVTFTVYADARGVEKTFPFDLIPRIIAAREWARLERGLTQRLEALELFLADVYGPQHAVRDGIIAPELITRAGGFLPRACGVTPPGGVRVHIAGIDLVRGGDGEFVVLEDNLRVPSGVSYVLENRDMLKRLIPTSFAQARVRSVDDYPLRLREALASLAPHGDAQQAQVVVLTPGPYNSAYFEHGFLARRMGVPLVEGRDLFTHQDRVYLRTTRGPKQVDVIYRRIDDDFLDPRAFRPDSALGVPGLWQAYQSGHVALANAPGNGVADSKAVYCFVPALIRYYLGEEPLLGQVPTFRCAQPDELAHVLDNLRDMVVKEVDGAGGYGMLVGPRSSAAEREAFVQRLRQSPQGYIAQPLVELSTCPTWGSGQVGPRRVDLRPYVVTGASGRWVLPGGLTRVALVEGSYVVNSSQGGGSKDTWVLDASEAQP